MTNIIDILLVVSECFLLVETVKSCKDAYDAYLDADTLEPSAPLMGRISGLHPVRYGRDCGTTYLPPDGQGEPLLNGKFYLPMIRAIKKGILTINSRCYKFTAIMGGSSKPGTWDDFSWNDPTSENAGGAAFGITSWNVQQMLSPPGPVYSYSPEAILKIAMFE